MIVRTNEGILAEQIELFKSIEIDKGAKPIRLVELFAGYGSQALALKYLELPFEHHAICEWAVKSIQAYKDLHFGEDAEDYSASLSDLEIVDFLDGRISSDYQTPMKREQIVRKGASWQRTVYNNMKATHNLGSITKIKGEDLGIEETDKYCFILTYSFPCQDLSVAGKGLGMEKGSGTRSALIWEVERILREMKELPQYLVMENVPQVVGKKNKPQFDKWLSVLSDLGYTSCWFVINAKDFGIAQNRKRVFCISALNNPFFSILPVGFSLKYRLKHFLEKNVDESYYLKDETVLSLNIHKARHEAKGHGFGWNPTDGGGCATTIKTESGYRPDSNFIIEQSREKGGESYGGGEYDIGKRLQRVWESTNERSS